MNKSGRLILIFEPFSFLLTALTSILHRISGIMLFIFLGLILYMLSKSLESEKGFNEVKEIFLHLSAKLVSGWYTLHLFIIS